MLWTKVSRGLLQAVLDSERREHSSSGVVFVGNGYAKQCHETVAVERVYRAFVAMDLVHGKLEEAVYQREHRFRSQALG